MIEEEPDADAAVDDGELLSCGFGSGCRLCGLQSDIEDIHVGKSEEGEGSRRTSNAMGWVRYRVDAVIRTSTTGTRRTAHFVLRPIRRLISMGDKGFGLSMKFFKESSSELDSYVDRGSGSLGSGRGDGGGVNIRTDDPLEVKEEG